MKHNDPEIISFVSTGNLWDNNFTKFLGIKNNSSTWSSWGYMEKTLKEMKESLDRNSEVITDLTLRITAIEQVLFKNNIVTEDQMAEELKAIVDKISQMIPAMAQQLEQAELEKSVEE